MAESKRVNDSTDRFTSAAEMGAQKTTGEDPLVALLLTGSPEALARLYKRYYGDMLALARSHVRDFATAEDLVQDTWTAIIKGIVDFKGKCSFKTWVFKILSNKARTIRRRESRLAAIKLLLGLESERDRSVRFCAAASCSNPVERWPATPEELMLCGELRQEMQRFIGSLPPRRCQVYVLRDIEGRSAQTVCELLGISSANQRILLHRARVAIYEWYSARARRQAGNSPHSGKGFVL